MQNSGDGHAYRSFLVCSGDDDSVGHAEPVAGVAARKDLDLADSAVPTGSSNCLGSLEQQSEEQAAAASFTSDPELRRQVAEEVRMIRQGFAAVANAPAARSTFLRRRLNGELRWSPWCSEWQVEG